MNTLRLDNRIARLLAHQEELTLTEEDFKLCIKAYKLKESLIILGEISRKLWNRGFPEDITIGQAGIRTNKGIFVTQFAIEYISNIFLISGSNDHKAKNINTLENLPGIFFLYSNCIKTYYGEGLTSLITSISFEQFKSQTDERSMMVRSFYIYVKITSLTNHIDQISEPLDSIFKRETGLHIKEFFYMSTIIWGFLIKNIRLNIGEFEKPYNQGEDIWLTEENFKKFLKIISCDYKEFRQIDEEKNKDLKPQFTKNRYNPLWIKPLIRISDNDYICPSLTAYIRATYQGLKWWFDNFFQGNGEDLRNFRSYQGKLFETYTGEILKSIYGKENVSRGPTYIKNKTEAEFTDWVVVNKNVSLIFESKSYQFSLNTVQTGDSERIHEEIDKKIIKAIEQLYKRIRDVETVKELSHIKGKKIIPIIVTADISMVSTPLFRDYIDEKTQELEKNNPGISNMEFYILNIEELEYFELVSEEIDIEILLKRCILNPNTGFMLEIRKISENKGIKKETFITRNFDKILKELRSRVNQ